MNNINNLGKHPHTACCTVNVAIRHILCTGMYYFEVLITEGCRQHQQVAHSPQRQNEKIGHDKQLFFNEKSERT